jgi:hypothetical protein
MNQNGKYEKAKSARRNNLLFNKAKSDLYYICLLITEKWRTLGCISLHQALHAEMFWKGEPMENTCLERESSERCLWRT